MNGETYCKWFCDQWVDIKTFRFLSRCGQNKVVKKNTKIWQKIYGNGVCDCGKNIAVGELM